MGRSLEPASHGDVANALRGCPLLSASMHRVMRVMDAEPRIERRTVSARDVKARIRMFTPSRYLPAFVNDMYTRVASGVECVVLGLDTDVRVLFVQSDGFSTVTDADIAAVTWVLHATLPCLAQAFGGVPRINVTMCLCDDAAKKVPSPTQHIWGPANVNGGVTVMNVRARRGEGIFVYRREECLKVLLHELIHSHGADIHMHDFETRNPGIQAVIRQTLTLSTIRRDPALSIGEAYVDAFAMLVYAIVGAGIRLRHATTRPSSLDAAYEAEVVECVRRQLARAAEASACVCSRLTAFDGRGIVETSHVFSYYVAKGAILSDIGELSALPQHGIRDDADAWQFVVALTRALGSPKHAAAVVPRLAHGTHCDSARMSAALLWGTPWADVDQ